MRAKSIQHMSLAGANEVTVSANGAGVDVSALEGDVKVTLDSSAGGGADHTLDVKLQHSDDDATYTDVTGGAFAQVTNAAAAFESLTLKGDGLKKYLRVVDTIAGTAPSFKRGVSLVGEKKYS